MRHLLQKHYHSLRQLFNAGLRLSSLGLKLLLTLYMGRYLGLTEMGTYGLVAAIVAVSLPLLGMRIDYVMTREIVDMPQLDLTRRLRDQILFYGMNYLLFIGAALIFSVAFPDVVEPKVIYFATLLAIVEGLGTYTSGNLVPLRQPVLSTAIFFIRSALWVIPVMGVGFFVPAFRTADFVFYCWLGCAFLSLVLTAFIWRHLPWRDVLALPMDWAWLRKSIWTCLPMWLGAIGMAVANNSDRFAVEHYLGRDFVGITSFYNSFAGAITAMVASGIVIFTQPDLVAAYRRNDAAEFRRTAKMMTVQIATSSAVMALLVGLIVPQLGSYLGRSELSEHSLVLWLVLVGVWLRMSVEGLYYVLYSRHQDIAIWSGNIVMLGVSALSNIWFVSHYGFIGVGYSAVANGLFVVIWRVIFTYTGSKTLREDIHV